LFQPAEEGGGGGRRMVEDGCLDGRVIGPPIDRMFGLHGWPSSPIGVVSTKEGPLFAASDRFEIAVRGHGGHAAWPEMCRDPIVAASAVVQAIQSIVSRNVAPQDPAVVSVTRFDAGTSFNIIPDGAVLQGTVRTLRTEVQELVRQRLGEIVQQVSAAHGCDATFEYIVNYPVMVNDGAAAETVGRIAAEAFGSERSRLAEQPEMVGEDFAFYGQRIPACFFLLGLRPPGATSMPSLHHPRFDFNDEAIAPGIEMFVRLALAG
ncbi:MAG: amidohydrolase, partial [Phycisphaerales bacterium]|nr:amidohydrolase [Phycisphaerales bacterium]